MPIDAGFREIFVGDAVPMVEIWRGGMPESLHRGHAIICDHSGTVIQAWGDPEKTIFPRSACKMLQALPLLESGAARAAALGSEQLALACASHDGALIHTEKVEHWLTAIGKSDVDLRCGAHAPAAAEDRFRLHDAGVRPCQIHNNCSGKHTGFLTLAKHLRAGAEYVEVDHPVQQAVKLSFEEMTGEASKGIGIDGCSAPNFATSMTGFARALAKMARPNGLGKSRELAARTLVDAMLEHPLLVEGVGKACSELMAAMDGVAVKNGAEGVYAAILPKQGIGVAIKIEDGASRAAEAAIAAVLIKLGVLDANHPSAKKRVNTIQKNWRGLEVGTVVAAF